MRLGVLSEVVVTAVPPLFCETIVMLFTPDVVSTPVPDTTMLYLPFVRTELLGDCVTPLKEMPFVFTETVGFTKSI